MRQHGYPFYIAGSIALYCLFTASPAKGQIIPDATLPNNSNVINQSKTNIITGGTRIGRNLFHSFAQFSIPKGSMAYFNNDLNVRNIISRVTGKSVSNIDGLIQAKGTANLFLLNPNGIVFGPNASLNIGGAFLGTTANSINFMDGVQFSATAPQTSPLLTISIPVGLQFGRNAGEIRLQGSGLAVQPGQTLTLVGGGVTLEGGDLAALGGTNLAAPGGRIELGSVGTGLVNLTPIDKGWALGYGGIQDFKDIQLSQGAYIDASGDGGGDIQLHGRQVSLTDGSEIRDATTGLGPGRTLAVTASDSVELSGASYLDTETITAGDASDIKIDVRKLIVQNQSTVYTLTQNASGRGGNLSVIASDFAELMNSGSLYTQATGTGSAGNLKIETGQLIAGNGGQISTSSISGQGNSGNIEVNASTAVNLFGVDPSSGYSSGLFARTFGEGQGGSITINTYDFLVANGAVVDAIAQKGSGGSVTIAANTFKAVNGGQVLTTTRGRGDAGSITVNANDSVTLAGSDPNFTGRVVQFPNKVENEGSASGLFANTDRESTGNGGNLTINTRQLEISDGASVTVSSLGAGNAGNLFIDPGLVKLDQGTLAAETESGEGGNITIQGRSIELRNNSLLSTTARGSGNGGNITINAGTLVSLENSDIVANALTGPGGNIKIKTQGTFLSADSAITASSQRGINGTVQINTLVNNPSQGLVTLPIKPVNITGQIAQGCPAGVGPRASKFVVTGRGGLPPDPTEALRSEPTLADLGTTVQSQENRTSTTSSNPSSSNSAPLVEAQGWVTNAKGEVELVAQVPTVTLDIPWLAPTICQATKIAS